MIYLRNLMMRLLINIWFSFRVVRNNIDDVTTNHSDRWIYFLGQGYRRLCAPTHRNVYPHFFRWIHHKTFKYFSTGIRIYAILSNFDIETNFTIFETITNFPLKYMLFSPVLMFFENIIPVCSIFNQHLRFVTIF